MPQTIYHGNEKQIIYALYDIKACVYGVPMVYADGEDPQQFLSMLVNTKCSGMLNTNPEDFILYKIGEVNNGKVFPVEHTIACNVAGLRKRIKLTSNRSIEEQEELEEFDRQKEFSNIPLDADLRG